MKKVAVWGYYIAGVINLVVLGVIGVKLLDGNYDFLVEAYVSAACFLVMFICAVMRICASRCPHCNRIAWDNGKYCSHCGKKLKD